ncbi:MAG: signal peptidase I [bacterium]|nr:signal peptidase I [bacterium]
MKKTGFVIRELLIIGVVAAIIVIPIRMFIFQPFLVNGSSMEPNFHNGDYLLIDEISFRLRAPERGEVIVFKYPENPSQKYIKRIIGLPGETIEVKEGKVRITGPAEDFVLDEDVYLPGIETMGVDTLKLASDEYFVLGDNREHSSDSRYWGSVPKENLIGRVWWRVIPGTLFTAISEKLPIL